MYCPISIDNAYNNTSCYSLESYSPFDWFLCILYYSVLDTVWTFPHGHYSGSHYVYISPNNTSIYKWRLIYHRPVPACGLIFLSMIIKKGLIYSINLVAIIPNLIPFVHALDIFSWNAGPWWNAILLMLSSYRWRGCMGLTKGPLTR